MTKRQGFNIRIDAFLPIDKTDFAAQAAAFQTIADIQKTGKLPDGFLDRVTILGITPKQGSAEIAEPARAAADEPVLPEVAEADAVNEMVGDAVTKRGGKVVSE